MKKRNIFNVVLVFIWMILIFIMSSQNGVESTKDSGFFVNIITNLFNIKNIDMLTFIIRKFAHFVEYFILGVLVYNMFFNYHRKWYYSLILCSIYAVSDEIHQLFIPGRSGQIKDVCIDTFGSLCGIISILLIYNYLSKKNKLNTKNI